MKVILFFVVVFIAFVASFSSLEEGNFTGSIIAFAVVGLYIWWVTAPSKKS